MAFLGIVHNNSYSFSVYNHYNRVRANLSILEQEEQERDAELEGFIDRMFPSMFYIRF